jgi:uncharacterized protein YcfL
MKPILLLCFAVGLIGLAGLTGCSTTVNSTENAQPSYQKNMVDEKRVITDSTLARKVQILGVNDAMTPAGFLRVQVELRNNTSSVQKFGYKFEWFDENGLVVGGPTSVVLSRQIEGKETLFLTGIATVGNARDFRLKLYENTH